jgi:acetyl-CoA carboxylase biotin carboxylase subunit
MVAKLIVKGATRNEALSRAKRALREFHIGGIHSTIPFHLYMLQDEQFVACDYDLNYVDTLLSEGCEFDPNL